MIQRGKHLTSHEQRVIISAMRAAHYWLHDSGDSGDRDICRRLNKALSMMGIDTKNDATIYNPQIASEAQ